MASYILFLRKQRLLSRMEVWGVWRDRGISRGGCESEELGNSTARKPCRIRNCQEMKPRSLTTARDGGCQGLPRP